MSEAIDENLNQESCWGRNEKRNSEAIAQRDWRSRKRDNCHSVASPDAPDNDLKPGTWTRTYCLAIILVNPNKVFFNEKLFTNNSQAINMERVKLFLRLNSQGRLCQSARPSRVNQPVILCQQQLSLGGNMDPKERVK